ncbi:MAG: cellulase family glycosylhydrolase [Anaerolineae bacterium]|nr:cellulase family glycosylhydrolase [Anaerolineae bacterium]
MTFTMHRGTNISHWLSQSKQRGEARRVWFTQQDVETIAGLGFDHIRIPIDEEQMWAGTGQPEEEAFALLDAALDWCEQAGLGAVVDLHILRSHYFNDKTGVPKLFTDPAEQERFCKLWRDLSDRLHKRENNLVAYELLNEAVARDPEDWNRVAMAAFGTVRDLEPERTIVLGSNWYCDTHTFDRLAVPDDPNCILTFHYYKPMLVTHHQAGWWDGGVYDGPVHYPGTPVAPEDVARLPPELQGKMGGWNASFDRSSMIADLEKPLAVRKQTGRPLYCGEFGCYYKTPQAVRLAWYRDMMHTLNEYGIAWANWDYKGSFGIVTPDGQDTGIAGVLLAQ